MIRDLIPVFIVAIIVIGVLSYNKQTRKSNLRAQDKKSLDLYRDFIARIDDLAYEYRDIDPELSVMIRDEIRLLHKKELT